MAERIDFVNHKTGDWSFYYHYDDATAVQPVYNQQRQCRPSRLSTGNPSRSQLFVLSNTKTIGATTVNVARLQFFRWAEHTATPSAGSAISSYSKYGYNTDPANGGLINTGPPGYPSSAPTMFFNSFTIGTNWLNLYQPETNYGVGDVVSKTIRNHALSFGGDFRYYQLNARNTCGPNGYFNFNGVETNADVSDYFIGAPESFVQCSIQLLDNRTRYGGLFVEDSWKATPNLTVNYGLRWDVARPWSDVYGRFTTPVPGEQSVKFPNSPPGNLVPGDPGVPNTISPTRWTNFGPRLGIAYAPSGGIFGAAGLTSIRAAFGLYYLGVADNGNFGILGDAPWGLYWASPQPTEFGSPYITRANSVTQGQHFPFVFPSGPGPFPNFEFGNLMPLYVPGYYTKNKTDTAQHMNLSIQRQLGRSTVATVAYVATMAHHLEHGTPIIWQTRPFANRWPAAVRAAKAVFTSKAALRITEHWSGLWTTRPSAPTTTILPEDRLWPLPRRNTCRTRETPATTHCRPRWNAALVMSPSCSPIPTRSRWMTLALCGILAIRLPPMAPLRGTCVIALSPVTTGVFPSIVSSAPTVIPWDGVLRVSAALTLVPGEHGEHR